MAKARERTYRSAWGTWQDLLAKLEPNIGALPQLQPFQVKLMAILAQVLGISHQQDAMRASKQEASKQLRKLVTEGNRLAAVIRAAIKEHYGPTEERIAEFGLQPFRGRKVSADSETPIPETPEAPTVPAPSDVKP
jgi:hypothetical protein